MRGDLIVRPSFAEANVQRIPGGELPDNTYASSTVRALPARASHQATSTLPAYFHVLYHPAIETAV